MGAFAEGAPLEQLGKQSPKASFCRGKWSGELVLASRRMDGTLMAGSRGSKCRMLARDCYKFLLSLHP